MELRHLRYFVAVAETENVSRAALKLHVSQPALSRQIRDLEDEIGFALFERTAKSISLTDAGRVLLKDAGLLLQQAGEAVKKARAVASSEPSELHVGYSPTPTAHLLPHILRAYRRALPQVQVKLHDWTNEENVAGVRDGRLQLALVVRPLKATELRGLHYEELIRQRVCLAVAPHHPFANRRSIPLAEAVHEPFIGLTREDYPGYFDFLAAVFAPTRKKPRVIEEHDSMSGIVSAIEAGSGVSLAADALGYTFGQRVRLIPVTPEPKPIAIGLAGPKGRLIPAAEKFWRCATEAASTISSKRK